METILEISDPAVDEYLETRSLGATVQGSVRIAAKEAVARIASSSKPIEGTDILTDGEWAVRISGNIVESCLPVSGIPKTAKKQFGWAYVRLPQEVRDAMKRIRDKIDPEDLDEDGKEGHPHITTKYGLTTSDPAEVQEATLGNRGGKVRMGKTSLFEKDDKDVLKVSVTSHALHALWKSLSEIDNEDKFDEYEPHATLAYLKPGTGKKYKNLETVDGMEFVFDEFVFEDSKDVKTEIKLDGKAPLIRIAFSQQVRLPSKGTDNHGNTFVAYLDWKKTRIADSLTALPMIVVEEESGQTYERSSWLLETAKDLATKTNGDRILLDMGRGWWLNGIAAIIRDAEREVKKQERKTAIDEVTRRRPPPDISMELPLGEDDADGIFAISKKKMVKKAQFFDDEDDDFFAAGFASDAIREQEAAAAAAKARNKFNPVTDTGKWLYAHVSAEDTNNQTVMERAKPIIGPSPIGVAVVVAIFPRMTDDLSVSTPEMSEMMRAIRAVGFDCSPRVWIEKPIFVARRSELKNLQGDDRFTESDLAKEYLLRSLGLSEIFFVQELSNTGWTSFNIIAFAFSEEEARTAIRAFVDGPMGRAQGRTINEFRVVSSTRGPLNNPPDIAERFTVESRILADGGEWTADARFAVYDSEAAARDGIGNVLLRAQDRDIPAPREYRVVSNTRRDIDNPNTDPFNQNVPFAPHLDNIARMVLGHTYSWAYNENSRPPHPELTSGVYVGTNEPTTPLALNFITSDHGGTSVAVSHIRRIWLGDRAAPAELFIVERRNGDSWTIDYADAFNRGRGFDTEEQAREAIARFVINHGASTTDYAVRSSTRGRLQTENAAPEGNENAAPEGEEFRIEYRTFLAWQDQPDLGRYPTEARARAALATYLRQHPEYNDAEAFRIVRTTFSVQIPNAQGDWVSFQVQPWFEETYPTAGEAGRAIRNYVDAFDNSYGAGRLSARFRVINNNNGEEVPLLSLNVRQRQASSSLPHRKAQFDDEDEEFQILTHEMEPLPPMPTLRNGKKPILSISRAVAGKMSRILRSMGFHSKGADDVLEALMGRSNGRRPMLDRGELWHPAWERAYEMAIKKMTARLDKQAQFDFDGEDEEFQILTHEMEPPPVRRPFGCSCKDHGNGQPHLPGCPLYVAPTPDTPQVTPTAGTTMWMIQQETVNDWEYFGNYSDDDREEPNEFYNSESIANNDIDETVRDMADENMDGYERDSFRAVPCRFAIEARFTIANRTAEWEDGGWVDDAGNRITFATPDEAREEIDNFIDNLIANNPTTNRDRNNFRVVPVIAEGITTAQEEPLGSRSFIEQRNDEGDWVRVVGDDNLPVSFSNDTEAEDFIAQHAFDGETMGDRTRDISRYRVVTEDQDEPQEGGNIEQARWFFAAIVITPAMATRGQGMSRYAGDFLVAFSPVGYWNEHHGIDFEEDDDMVDALGELDALNPLGILAGSENDFANQHVLAAGQMNAIRRDPRFQENNEIAELLQRNTRLVDPGRGRLGEGAGGPTFDGVSLVRGNTYSITYAPRIRDEHPDFDTTANFYSIRDSGALEFMRLNGTRATGHLFVVPQDWILGLIPYAPNPPHWLTEDASGMVSMYGVPMIVGNRYEWAYSGPFRTPAGRFGFGTRGVLREIRLDQQNLVFRGIRGGGEDFILPSSWLESIRELPPPRRRRASADGVEKTAQFDDEEDEFFPITVQDLEIASVPKRPQPAAAPKPAPVPAQAPAQAPVTNFRIEKLEEDGTTSTVFENTPFGTGGRRNAFSSIEDTKVALWMILSCPDQNPDKYKVVGPDGPISDAVWWEDVAGRISYVVQYRAPSGEWEKSIQPFNPPTYDNASSATRNFIAQHPNFGENDVRIVASHTIAGDEVEEERPQDAKWIYRADLMSTQDRVREHMPPGTYMVIFSRTNITQRNSIGGRPDVELNMILSTRSLGRKTSGYGSNSRRMITSTDLSLLAQDNRFANVALRFFVHTNMAGHTGSEVWRPSAQSHKTAEDAIFSAATEISEFAHLHDDHPEGTRHVRVADGAGNESPLAGKFVVVVRTILYPEEAMFAPVRKPSGRMASLRRIFSGIEEASDAAMGWCVNNAVSHHAFDIVDMETQQVVPLTRAAAGRATPLQDTEGINVGGTRAVIGRGYRLYYTPEAPDRRILNGTLTGIDGATLVFGDFRIPISWLDRISTLDVAESPTRVARTTRKAQFEDEDEYFPITAADLEPPRFPPDRPVAPPSNPSAAPFRVTEWNDSDDNLGRTTVSSNTTIQEACLVVAMMARSRPITDFAIDGPAGNVELFQLKNRGPDGSLERIGMMRDVFATETEARSAAESLHPLSTGSGWATHIISNTRGDVTDPTVRSFLPPYSPQRLVDLRSGLGREWTAVGPTSYGDQASAWESAQRLAEANGWKMSDMGVTDARGVLLPPRESTASNAGMTRTAQFDDDDDFDMQFIGEASQEAYERSMMANREQFVVQYRTSYGWVLPEWNKPWKTNEPKRPVSLASEAQARRTIADYVAEKGSVFSPPLTINQFRVVSTKNGILPTPKFMVYYIAKTGRRISVQGELAGPFRNRDDAQYALDHRLAERPTTAKKEKYEIVDESHTSDDGAPVADGSDGKPELFYVQHGENNNSLEFLVGKNKKLKEFKTEDDAFKAAAKVLATSDVPHTARVVSSHRGVIDPRPNADDRGDRQRLPDQPTRQDNATNIDMRSIETGGTYRVIFLDEDGDRRERTGVIGRYAGNPPREAFELVDDEDHHFRIPWNRIADIRREQATEETDVQDQSMRLTSVLPSPESFIRGQVYSWSSTTPGDGHSTRGTFLERRIQGNGRRRLFFENSDGQFDVYHDTMYGVTIEIQNADDLFRAFHNANPQVISEARARFESGNNEEVLAAEVRNIMEAARAWYRNIRTSFNGNWENGWDEVSEEIEEKVRDAIIYDP